MTTLKESLVTGQHGAERLKGAAFAKARPPVGSMRRRLDDYFLMSRRGSDISTEIRAGTTAFLAASNNFVVNAHIMQHAGIDPSVSVISGAFSAAFTCILCGLLSNLPLGLVPSVGPNVFLAFSLVAKGVVNTDQALAISGATGIMLLFLSLTPVLKVVLGLVPLCIKYGLIIGTGLLSALIGLKSIGVVVPDTGPSHDIVALGRLDDLPVYIAAVALIIMASMLHNGVKGAVLLGMLGATLADWILNGDMPGEFVKLGHVTPHAVEFSVLLDPSSWVQVFALLLMLLFSISGAVIGSGRMAGLLSEEGTVPGSTAVYVVCGVGTLLSSLLGTSPIFVSMSAAAGVREGGRTGLTSIVMGMWCLLTAFLLSPIAAAIPPCAVAPVLILVGVSMVGEAKEVAWWSMQEALPAFLCAVFQPFTYSVSNGIFAGMTMSCVLFFTTGEFVTYMPGYRQRIEAEVEAFITPAVGTSETRSRTPMIARHVEKQLAVAKSIGDSLNSHGFRTGKQNGEAHGTLSQVTTSNSWSSPNDSNVADRLKRNQPGKMARRYSFNVQDLEAMQENEEAPENAPRIRGAFSSVGRNARLQAMDLIDKAAALIGLDPAEVHRAVEERLHAGRSVEAHCMGGVSASEANLARIISESCGDIHGMSENNGAPLIAAAARRNRQRRIGSSPDLCAAVEIMQTPLDHI
mmetsp:Transcript_53405/g.153180  ORF Transcript_53405/g.153180 Transcript_53405/m.153180 type:complete len:689 (-) Transcript_53405:67-2133(-)